MADTEKRIIEFNPASALENDDWFAVDSPTTGTRKVQKTQIMGDEITRIEDLETEQTAAQLAINNLQDRVGMSTALNFGDNVTDGVNVLKAIEGTDAYSTTKTYAVGDYCIYNDTLYKCTTAVTTAEAFDTTKWQATSTKAELSSLNSSLAKVKFTKFTYTYDAVTIQANSNVTVNATNSKPSNLTHIAVEYFNSGNGNAFFRYINAGSGAMNIHNNSSSAITITPTLVITCVDSTLV